MVCFGSSSMIKKQKVTKMFGKLSLIKPREIFKNTIIKNTEYLKNLKFKKLKNFKIQKNIIHQINI